jgi:hypothetical protein
MQFFRNRLEDFYRDPMGTFLDLTMTIFVYGFGIYMVLSAGKCATNLVASAL